MPYEIVIQDTKLVVITFTGESTLEENERAREELVKINRDTGIFRVISDWRTATIHDSVWTKDLHEFGNTWPKTIDEKCFVVAVVLSISNTPSHFGVDFSNNVARANGLVSKIFWEISDALEWLESSMTT